MATTRKPGKPAAKPTAAKPAVKAAAPRKPQEKDGPPFTGNMQPDPSPEQLWKMIAEAAYYRAKARDFAPGGEVGDWIEAEAEVMRRLGRPAP